MGKHNGLDPTLRAKIQTLWNQGLRKFKESDFIVEKVLASKNQDEQDDIIQENIEKEKADTKPVNEKPKRSCGVEGCDSITRNIWVHLKKSHKLNNKVLTNLPCLDSQQVSLCSNTYTIST